MTYPPAGGTPDPYQPQQPYGQQPYDPSQPYPHDPYAAPASGSPSSGAPISGQPYPPQYGVSKDGAPPYGQPGYGQPGYGPGYPPYQQAGTNTMAILALVFAFIFAPAAIVMGHVAKKQIRQTGEQGDGLATAGLWLGYIFTGLYLAICAFYVIVVIGVVGASSTGY